LILVSDYYVIMDFDCRQKLDFASNMLWLWWYQGS